MRISLATKMLLSPEETALIKALVLKMHEANPELELFSEKDTYIGEILSKEGSATELDAWDFPAKGTNMVVIYDDPDMLDMLLLEFDVDDIVYMESLKALNAAVELAPSPKV